MCTGFCSGWAGCVVRFSTCAASDRGTGPAPGVRCCLLPCRTGVSACALVSANPFCVFARAFSNSSIRELARARNCATKSSYSMVTTHLPCVTGVGCQGNPVIQPDQTAQVAGAELAELISAVPRPPEPQEQPERPERPEWPELPELPEPGVAQALTQMTASWVSGSPPRLQAPHSAMVWEQVQEPGGVAPLVWQYSLPPSQYPSIECPAIQRTLMTLPPQATVPVPLLGSEVSSPMHHLGSPVPPLPPGHALPVPGS